MSTISDSPLRKIVNKLHDRKDESDVSLLDRLSSEELVYLQKLIADVAHEKYWKATQK